MTMPSLFPTASAMSAAFGTTYNRDAAPAPAKRSPYEARTELYQSWSVAEDAKQKTAQLADVAAKEYGKASGAAQKQVGSIELYSAKYYAT